MTPESPNDRESIRRALRGECPSVEELERRAAEPALRAHLDSCPRCRAELELLEDFRSAQPRPGEEEQAAWIEKVLLETEAARLPAPAPETQAVPWWKALFAGSRLRAASLAMAALAMAAGLSVMLRRDSEPAPPVYEPGGPVRSQEIELLEPVGRVAAAPRVFRWQAVAGAADYELRVAGIDRVEVWQTSTTESSAPVPEQAARLFAVRGTLRWRVVAFDAKRAVLARSAEKEFTLR
jgi:hypothetical protein